MYRNNDCLNTFLVIDLVIRFLSECCPNLTKVHFMAGYPKEVMEEVRTGKTIPDEQLENLDQYIHTLGSSHVNRIVEV
jgi:hypothetical protein